MILPGTVNPERQPIIRVIVRGPQGQELTVEAILDFGYNGTLTLPPVVVSLLGLPLVGHGKLVYADGRSAEEPIHRGRILWEGVERPIRIVASGNQALFGMALLVGYRFCVEMVDGGEVTIE